MALNDYDIIGDIHGHSDPLEQLLQKMGYMRRMGIYSHPEGRKVIFVGDFIDRGPRIRETLHLVKDMCDSGNALAVMGNHEYNAVCFHTPHTEKGGFFRKHTYKEIYQHFETLKQFQHYRSEFDYFLAWFRTLPMYLDLDHLRVVHACWDQKNIDWLKNNYSALNSDFLTRVSDKEKHNRAYLAVEETLKGKEEELPDGLTFTDKDGSPRHECRLRWWSPNTERKSLGDVMIGCPPEIANNKIDSHKKYFSYECDKPVFFGHYWLNGNPELSGNEKAICLDYSIARGGKLVACRLTVKDDKTKKEIISVQYQKTLPQIETI